jgi:DNA repair ATPase RecN
MDSEKLAKLKTSLASFTEIVEIVKELIEEVENGGDLDREELLSQASDAEAEIDNVRRNLDEAESYVSSALTDCDDARSAIRELIKTLEK